MGMSHLAILGGLLGVGEVALCESSRLTRYLFSRIGVRTFASLDEALDRARPCRGAIVATPTATHFPIARTLLRRAIPCFVEKPLTLNPAHSQELMSLQASSGTTVQVGLVARFIRSFAQLHWIVRSGLLGHATAYTASMLGNVITKPDNKGWRSDFARGGGCLNEYGPHLLDLCRWVFGDVDAVESAAFGRVYSTRADDNVRIDLRHQAGIVGSIRLDWCDTSKRKSFIDFEIECEAGTVRASNVDLSVDIKPGADLTPEARAALLAPVLPFPVNFYLRGEEYSLQLEVFLERILGRKLVRAEIEPDTAASIRDGFEVDRLIRDIATLAGLA